MSYKIYKHTLPDGRAYVGLTSKKPEQRWRGGRGYEANIPFFEEIIRVGWNNIQHEILEEVATKEEGLSRESYYIKLFETNDPAKGFNKHSEVTSKTKRKKVFVCIETGEVFHSLKAAAKTVNRVVSAISMAATNGTTCGGYHWKIDYEEI